MSSDQVVDARDLRCPLPVIRLARAAHEAPAGTTIALLSTDPAAGPDVAAWCRMRGHHLLAQHAGDDAESVGDSTGDPDGGWLVSVVEVRPGTPVERAPAGPPPAGRGTPPA